MYSHFNCQSHRRFGVEVELNTLDGVVRELNKAAKDIPLGSDYVSCLIKHTLHKTVEIRDWMHYHNNDVWIVKPDASCGIEVCTPILKGWQDLKSLLKVIQAFKQSEKIVADRRCSLHVHVNIADLTLQQLGSVLSYYIKCEHVIFDSIPAYRKNNSFCEFVGMADLFQHDFPMHAGSIINKLGTTKYLSINTYHFVAGGGFMGLRENNLCRPTIEFRVAENEACLDPLFAKCWIRFLLHFVEVTKDLPLPRDYREGDAWSGLLWLSPKDVFKLLKFDQNLSDGLQQVKNWFIKRILVNGVDELLGIWSKAGRQSARDEFLEMYGDFSDDLDESQDDLIFGDKYVN